MIALTNPEFVEWLESIGITPEQYRQAIQGIAVLAKVCNAMATSKGWWETGRNFPECVALMHSELSEALEEYRDGEGHGDIRLSKDGKPVGMPIELADCIIRILDASEQYGMPMDRALDAKLAYNWTRPYRHGNKRA